MSHRHNRDENGDFARVVISILLTIVMVAGCLPIQGLAAATELATEENVTSITPKDADDEKSKTDSDTDGDDVDRKAAPADNALPDTELVTGDDQVSSTKTPARERVTVSFDSNVTDASTVTGLMPDVETDADATLELPANVFVRDGFEFAGWSLTADGTAMPDDPATNEIDESTDAVLVPDGATLSNLTYVEHTKTGDVTHDLRHAIRDGRLVLMAQWKSVRRDDTANVNDVAVTTTTAGDDEPMAKTEDDAAESLDAEDKIRSTTLASPLSAPMRAPSANGPLTATLSTYAVITDDGDLVFLNATEQPVAVEGSSSRKSVTDVTGVVWTGTVYNNPETTSSWTGSSVVKRAYVASGSTYAPQRLSFDSMSNLESVNFDGIDTSNLNSMSYMFSGCAKIESIDLRGLDTSNVSSMDATFSGCRNLRSVNFSGIDTSRVSSMNATFSYCTSLSDVPGLKWLDVSNLTSMLATFQRCTSLKTIDLSGWRPSKLTNMGGTFESSTADIDISNWNAPLLSATMLTNGLSGSLAKTIRACDMRTGRNVSSGNSLMMGSNASLISLDMSGSTIYDMTSVNIYNLRSITEMNFDHASFPKLQYLGIKTNPSLERIRLSGTSMPVATRLDFQDNVKLQSLDTSSTYVLSITSTEAMFANCTSLASVNLSGLAGCRLTTTQNMFTLCASLRSADLRDLDVSHVTTMQGMFNGCTSLESVDMSTWDTSSVTNMQDMFKSCNDLQTLVLGPAFSFTGDDSLPTGDWKNQTTGLTLSDLWNDYDGTTMYGTYVRAMTTIDRNDVYHDANDQVQDVSYDPENKEIVIYLRSPENIAPAPVSLPALATYLKVHSDVMTECPGLTDVLDAAIAGDPSTNGLTVSVRTMTYADVTSCATSDRVILTLDVPKSQERPMRADLYRRRLDADDYEYAGHLENRPDDLTTFDLYDAEGNLIDTVTKNQRHTEAQLMGLAPEHDTIYDTPVLPTYEQYLSYDPDMDNYEIVVEPARYRMVFSSPDHERIPVTDVATVTESNVTRYLLDLAHDADVTKLSLFNDITSVEYEAFRSGHAAIGIFRKTDPSGIEETPVSGALYRFTGMSSGDVVYGRTDSNGAIRPCLSASAIVNPYPTSDPDTRYMTQVNYSDQVLFQTLGSDGTLSNPCLPRTDETYIVEEIESPPGFYLNPETTTISFVSQVTSPLSLGNRTAIMRDGTTTTSYASVRRVDEQCLSCSSERMCMCHAYMSHDACPHCGIPQLGSVVESTDVTQSDQPYPRLEIAKRDDLGNGIDGAVLQVLREGRVIDEWTSAINNDGSPVYHHITLADSSETGVAYGERDVRLVLHEVTAPDDDHFLADDIPFLVSYDSGTTYVTMTDAISVDVPFMKTWSPEPPPNATATFALLADGMPTGRTITLDGIPDAEGETEPWVATFVDERRYDPITHEETTYAVMETASIFGWGPSDTTPIASGHTLTNVRRVAMPMTGARNDNDATAAIGLALVATASAAGVVVSRRRRQTV